VERVASLVELSLVPLSIFFASFLGLPIVEGSEQNGRGQLYAFMG
jgi:hypothetical protein